VAQALSVQSVGNKLDMLVVGVEVLLDQVSKVMVVNLLEVQVIRLQLV
jgi:hypothetical protein